MRRAFIVIVGLALSVLWPAPPAHATGMKSTAPERMLSRADSKKMRACDERAMRENIPMDQKAAFVKKCMVQMK